MALTADALVDRVRDVLVDLGHVEAVQGDFAKQPNGQVDRVFTVRFEGGTPRGGFSYTEESRGALDVALAVALNDNFVIARRTALQYGRAIEAAVVRDGSETSGEYAVEDAGRALTIEAPAGAAYLVARVRLPVNFEGSL